MAPYLPSCRRPRRCSPSPQVSPQTGDPLLRRSVCAAGRPACTQVSRCIGLSGSDREFPPLAGRSGTQRARHLGSRATVGTSAPRCSSPASELRITSGFSCVARGFKSRGSGAANKYAQLQRCRAFGEPSLSPFLRLHHASIDYESHRGTRLWVVRGPVPLAFLVLSAWELDRLWPVTSVIRQVRRPGIAVIDRSSPWPIAR